MSNQRHPGIASIREAIDATRDPGLSHHVEDYAVIVQSAEQAIASSLDELDATARAKDAAAAQRQRHEDEALADATNIVERMRDRNGRRVMSPLDGKAIRDIWTILKGVQSADGGSDGDGAWR